MRLQKGQKEILLTWIAEGLLSDEINQRAQVFEPPFHCSRQQVDWYRKTRQFEIRNMQADAELQALREGMKTGLAVKEMRVEKLKRIADKLEQDLLEKEKVWLANKKGVGSGDVAEIFDYYEFNKAEIDAYRGLLDDIARELGDRVQKVDATSAGQPITNVVRVITHDQDGDSP